MKTNHTQVDNELDLFSMMQNTESKEDSSDNHAKMVNYRSNTTFDEEKLGQQEDVQLVEKDITDDTTAAWRSNIIAHSTDCSASIFFGTSLSIFS